MDEIDQYEAFAALKEQGRSIAEIAGQFGVTELLVTRRLAIAELIDPILNAYRKGDIDPETLRQLTMATKAQQKAWFKLFRDPKQHAPTGKRLKAWLFGGAEIPVSSALFPLELYRGNIVSDLFGEERYSMTRKRSGSFNSRPSSTARPRILKPAGAMSSSWTLASASTNTTR